MAEIAATSAPENEPINFTASATNQDTPASELQYSLDERAKAGVYVLRFSWDNEVHNLRLIKL
jgi:hypothetical protein